MKVVLILFLFLFSKSWGQTTVWGLYSGGGAPTGWTFSNNVTTNAIDQTSYWLVDAGSPSDKITTSSYDLCTYGSATVCLQVATFGSGTNNPAKIEVSYDTKRIGGFSKAITIFSNAKTERKMIKIKGYVERISMPEKKKSMLSEDN